MGEWYCYGPSRFNSLDLESLYQATHSVPRFEGDTDRFVQVLYRIELAEQRQLGRGMLNRTGMNFDRIATVAQEQVRYSFSTLFSFLPGFFLLSLF